MTMPADDKYCRPIKLAVWIIALALGAIQIASHPHVLSSNDAIAYMDLGDAYLDGRWNDTINGYWSPVYGWLLAGTIAALQPDTYREFFTVKLINMASFLFALACFSFFLGRWIDFSRSISNTDQNRSVLLVPRWVWYLAGYSLFLWSSLGWIDLRSDTPDMLIAGLVYLSAGLLLKINSDPEELHNYFLIGMTLGIGYLTKTIMFPVGLVFLGVLFLITLKRRTGVLRLALTIATFALITGPQIVSLSADRGHPTFGDTGKLNYQWIIVGGIRGYKHWQGDEPGRGIPAHPTRLINASPEAFEFGEPVDGTYPPWHDPSYWYEGIESIFKLSNQRWALEKNLVYLGNLFLGAALFGYLMLSVVSGGIRNSIYCTSKGWPIILPALAGLALYALATSLGAGHDPFQRHTRYIAPFILLLLAGIFCCVRIPDGTTGRRMVRGIALGVAVIFSVKLVYLATSDIHLLVSDPGKNVQWEVAEQMKGLGVGSNTRVAILGKYGLPFHWVRLVRARIVAEIPDKASYWQSDLQTRKQLLDTIRETGAGILVQRPGSNTPSDEVLENEGWKNIGNGYFAYIF